MDTEFANLDGHKAFVEPITDNGKWSYETERASENGINDYFNSQKVETIHAMIESEYLVLNDVPPIASSIENEEDENQE